MSIKGVHCGLRLPLRMEATSDARCPTVWPLASITYHFRLPASSLPLGKYVDIVNYLCFQRVKRERLEYLRPEKVVKASRPEPLSAVARSLRSRITPEALANASPGLFQPWVR